MRSHGPNAEQELLRARWRTSGATLGLGDTSTPDYGQGGLAARVAGPAARLLIQPQDPGAYAIEFDDEFWSWFDTERRDPINGGKAGWGSEKVPTDVAACLAERWDDSGWQRCLALHHSGALDVILGRDVRWMQRGDTPAFGLLSLVGFVWNSFAWYSEVLAKWTKVVGPWEVRLGLIGTQNALLGGFASGWRQLCNSWDGQPKVTSPNLELRREVATWPADPQSLAYSFGIQIENAWGSRHRRFLTVEDKVLGEFGQDKWNW